MNSRPDNSVPSRTHARGGRRRPPFVVFLFFGLIAFLILKDRIPGLDDWYRKLVNEAEWRANKSCERAAIANMGANAFARIVTPGTMHKTRDGYLVENLIVGKMGPDGQEEKFTMTCYVSPTGDVVNSNTAPLSE